MLYAQFSIEVIVSALTWFGRGGPATVPRAHSQRSQGHMYCHHSLSIYHLPLPSISHHHPAIQIQNSKHSLRLFHHDFFHGSILSLVPPIQLPAINPDPIADFECALLPCRPAAQIRNISLIHVLIGFLRFGKLWVWK